MLTRRAVVTAALAWPAAALAQARPPADPAIGHAAALAEAARVQARADLLLREHGLHRDSVAERLRRLAADPRWLYPDSDRGRDWAVSDMNAALARVRPKLARAFDAPVPRAHVRRMSAADEAAKRGGYRDAAARAYYVDLSAIRTRPSWTLPTVAFHETVPGHLLQARVAQAPVDGGYAESWATYAEQLCAELGAYASDRLAELGYLHWRLFRLARIVADTGMQARGWSQPRAAEAMRQVQGFPIAFIGIEADVARMARRPGEYAQQGLGALALARLRPGDRARWPAFHRAAMAAPPWRSQG
jgi:uncharacterized protein (DUF885 family)